MAVAYVKEVGHATGSGTQLVIPISAAPAAGNLVVVRLGYRAGGTVVVSSVLDSKGNTVTADIVLDAAGGHIALISDPQDVAALTTADTITINLSASAANGISAVADEFSGVLTSASRVRATASAAAAGTARDSGTTAASPVLGDLAVAGFAGNGAESSFTPDKTALTTGFQNAVVGTGAFVEGEYSILGAGGAQRFQPTGGLSVTTEGAIAVYKAAPPVNTVAPAVTGTATQGQTLSCSTGTWTNAASFAYQWRRAGVSIGGATASTYLLDVADVGASIDCVVTATGIGTASATSNAVGPIAGLSTRPVLSATPATSAHTLSGTADAVLAGTYPGSTTFPGSDTYPGKGNDLQSVSITPKSLTATPNI